MLDLLKLLAQSRTVHRVAVLQLIALFVVDAPPWWMPWTPTIALALLIALVLVVNWLAWRQR